MTKITAASFTKNQSATAGIMATGQVKIYWPSNACLRERKGDEIMGSAISPIYQLFRVLKLLITVSSLNYPWRLHVLHTCIYNFYKQCLFYTVTAYENAVDSCMNNRNHFIVVKCQSVTGYDFCPEGQCSLSFPKIQLLFLSLLGSSFLVINYLTLSSVFNAKQGRKTI